MDCRSCSFFFGFFSIQSVVSCLPSEHLSEVKAQVEKSRNSLREEIDSTQEEDSIYRCSGHNSSMQCNAIHVLI